MKTGENELQPLLFRKEMFWKTLPGRQRCVSLFCNLLANTSIHRTVRGMVGCWLDVRVRLQQRYKRIGLEIAKSTIPVVLRHFERWLTITAVSPWQSELARR